MTIIRKQSGSMITFATALLMALVVLGLGFIAFLMYMGGQSETKNAVDSGTLNVGKQALDKVSVNLGVRANRRIFNDVASDKEGGAGLISDNKITLRRINRVWAKAMLIAINAEDARRLGAAGTGPSNARQAYNGAYSISKDLANKLKNQTNLHGFFTDYTMRNSVRMLGSNANVKVLPGAGWQTSLMERGGESNIQLTGSPPHFNLPPNFRTPSSYTTRTTRPNAPANTRNKWFLKGYKGLRIGTNTFWQVPFLYDEKPHMVSRSTFEANSSTTRPLSWVTAVPNAFSAQGQAGQRGSVGEKARSWVLTNPRQPFKLAIPHSFIHIQLDQMQVNWYFYPLGFPVKTRTTNYNYIARTQNAISVPGGAGCSWVSAASPLIGSEVTGRTVDDIIFGMPRGNTRRLESYLVNRINEMITEVGETKTSADLHRCLGAFDTRAALAASTGVTHFYVYSPDGKSLTCKPKAFARADLRVPWLATMINKQADGTEKKFIDDETQQTIFPFSLFCSPVPLPLFTVTVRQRWGSFHKDVSFKPGTGYNGNLGTVRVKRWTNVHSLGVAVPPI